MEGQQVITKKEKIINIINIIRVVVLILAVILMLIFAVAFNGQSKVSLTTIKEGKTYSFVVLSDSMVPKFESGDLITVKKINSSELKVGDIICFYSEDSVKYGSKITHKIYEIFEENGVVKYRTESASGQKDETPVSDDRVIGVLQKVVPNVGHFIVFAQSFTGYLVFVVIPLSILIIFQMFFVIKKFKEFLVVNKNKEMALAEENAALLEQLKQLQSKVEESKYNQDDNNNNN